MTVVDNVACWEKSHAVRIPAEAVHAEWLDSAAGSTTTPDLQTARRNLLWCSCSQTAVSEQKASGPSGMVEPEMERYAPQQATSPLQTLRRLSYVIGWFIGKGNGKSLRPLECHSARAMLRLQTVKLPEVRSAYADVQVLLREWPLLILSPPNI